MKKIKQNAGWIAIWVFLGLCLFGIWETQDGGGFPSPQKAQAEPLDSYHKRWFLVRETATEDGADLAAVYALATNKGNFASKDPCSVILGGAFPIRSSNRGISVGGAWAFIICGGLADDDTFSFDILGWAIANGPAQVIAHGDGVIGTQDVVLYPDDSAAAASIWWADTLNIDTVADWPGSIGIYNSGNDEICMLVIDMTGLEWVQFVMYECDGSGTEASNLTVYGRPY